MVNVSSGFSAFFAAYPGNPSISPLTGSVSNLNFYQVTPAHSVSGTVTMPPNEASGVKVMCVSTPGALFSQTASSLGDGKYQCSGLPVRGDYVITPSKLGFTFTPTTRNINGLSSDVFFVNFTGAVAPTRTISGKITDAMGTGVNGISLALSGSQTAATVSDVNGNYSFSGVLHGGNCTVTPSSTSFTFTPASTTFNNLTADQTANFTAAVSLQLILDDTGQVAALNSILLTRDPFPLLDTDNVFNAGVDRSTRIGIFLANFQLASGESPSSIIVKLIDSMGNTFQVPAEAVVVLSDVFTEVTFQLPDDVSIGPCTVAVIAHGQTSNSGVIRLK